MTHRQLTVSAALLLAAPLPAIAEGEVDTASTPRFVEAAFRTDVTVSSGRAVLELTAREPGPDHVRLQLGPDERVEFRDDGMVFDRIAGDGVFTGVVRADLGEEREIDDRLRSKLERDTLVPRFEGRELVELTRSSRFLVDAAPNTLPILTMSSSTTVLEDHSVAITDVSVLEDPLYTFNPCSGVGTPGGAWTFGHVMTELAGSMNPSDFTHHWLEHWLGIQTINGAVIDDRPPVVDEVLAAWPTLPNGELDMNRAPFRPLAIMLRVDLRSTSGYGSGNAGEARIVYCFIDVNCNARRFLPIFEYAINKTGCDVKQWGEDWAALSTMSLGSATYNAALEQLTRQFTDVTTSPNANHLGQLRTNEFIVAPWELREFRLDAGTGTLQQTTVALTPDEMHNDTPLVGDIMNGNTALLPGILGGAALTGFGGPPGNGVEVPFWEAPNVILNDDRHEFSLNTCNACHFRETDTPFTHISPAPWGTPTSLSGFLDGITVQDPVVSTVFRNFDDLDRRRQDLQNLIDTSCFGQLVFQSAVLSH